MNEVEQRQNVVALAKEWLGTPYISNGAIKGRRGGTDCAMLLLAVYADAGLVPKEYDPRPYPPTWHAHKNEERYMTIVRQFAKEYASPPNAPRPGDIVMFKLAKLFAHGGIIIQWPLIIHARASGREAAVLIEDVSKDHGKHALSTMEKKFFTYWPDGYINV